MTTTSSTDVAAGVWHDVQTRVRINGANSQTEVWLDGARVGTLSKTESLGTTPIGRIQLGDNSTGRIYDAALDNVAVNPAFIDLTPPIVNLTEPVADAIVRDSVTFAAEASDNLAMDRVEFLANGLIVGADYIPPYNFIWNSTVRSDGPVTLAVRATDNTFNQTDSISRVVIVDNTPPNTTITSGPTSTISDTLATFTFSSNDVGATITCVLDSVEIELCASPFTIENLAEGTHTFKVMSTDTAGNIDPTPAIRTWTVDVPATPRVVFLPFIKRDDAHISADSATGFFEP
jgi:hypothetical protein